MPRVGSGVRYTRKESRYEHADLSADTEPSAESQGEGTSRQAVNDRIQHLLVASPVDTSDSSPTPTPSRFSFLSARASTSRPTSSPPSPLRTNSKMLTPLPSHPSSAHLTPRPLSSHHPSKRKETQKRKYEPIPDHPPPPPTKGLPPFKIMSDEDLLDLLGEERILVLGTGRTVAFEWKPVDRYVHFCIFA